MNTFKRLGVGVLLLLTVGCAPMMTPYGPVPGWNVNAITGAGTGAMVGALTGTVFGNPGGGAALGAAIGGATSSHGYGYYPPQVYPSYQYQYPPQVYPSYQYPPQVYQPYYPRQQVCVSVDIGGGYTPYGQYLPNYQVQCR
jgi:hypothetical protein